MKRTQAGLAEDTEYVLDVPRPLSGLPAGQYHAIELHSLEYYIAYPALPHWGGHEETFVAITTSPRSGQVPFMTTAGDPSNLWFYVRRYFIPQEHGGVIPCGGIQTRKNQKALFTDDLGHGKLIIGDHLYLQMHTVNIATLAYVSFSFEYTETSVRCEEYAQELTAQLMVG